MDSESATGKADSKEGGRTDSQSGTGSKGPEVGESMIEKEVRLRAASPTRQMYRALKRRLQSLYARWVEYQMSFEESRKLARAETEAFHKEFKKLYEIKLKDAAEEGPEDMRRRQRRVLFFSLIAYGYFVYQFYGTKFKEYLTDEAVSVIKIILEKESLKDQVQSLSVGVIHALLQDQEVAATAATFLRDAAAVPETQYALVGLTIHVLQHPDTIMEFTLLIKKLIDVLVKDKVYHWKCL